MKKESKNRLASIQSVIWVIVNLPQKAKSETLDTYLFWGEKNKMKRNGNFRIGYPIPID